VRTCEATVERDGASVVSGLQDLVLLKSTGSEFRGFLVDEFTTLAETDDRILATSLVASWRHAGVDVDWNASYDEVRGVLLSTFATTYSRALQETLYLMGSAVVETMPGLAEISFSAPNKHHFLVDFSGFDVEGLTNEGEVFVAADRPYGLIECTVLRDPA
jgi:urate oxidase